MEVIKVPVSMDAAAAKRQIEDLPWCLMIEILSRLPIRTLLMCRCVCKSWLLLFSDPFFVKLQLAKSPTCIVKTNSSVETRRKKVDFMWFVDEEEEEGIDSGLRIETAVIDFPIRPTGCLNSCNGLLCLKLDRPRSIWVGNPILREWITIQPPPSPYPDGTYWPPSYAFGFSPKSNQYKLLCLQRLRANQYATTIYTLGTGQWRFLEGMSPLERRFRGFSGTSLSTFMNGSLHWMSRGMCLAISIPFISYFDFENERFGTLPLPPHPYRFRYAVELAVLNGHLSASVDDTKFVKIWGMKEYGVEKSWTLMHAIAYPEPSVLGGPQLVFPCNAEDILNYEDDLRVLLSLNEDEVLMMCGFSSSFVSFNTKTRRCRIPKRPQYGTCLTAYNPSFVSLHDVAMEECMVVQSRSAGRKRMLENEANRTASKSMGLLPRKCFYRPRADSNSLSDSHFPVPVSPSHVG